MSAAYTNSLSESCSRWMYKPINWEFSGACRDSGLWRKKGQDRRQDGMKLLRVIPYSFSKKNQSIKLEANKTQKYTDMIHTMLLSACANDAYYVHCMHFKHIRTYVPCKFKVEWCFWYFELTVHLVEHGDTRSFLYTYVQGRTGRQ